MKVANERTVELSLGKMSDLISETLSGLSKIRLARLPDGAATAVCLIAPYVPQWESLQKDFLNLVSRLIKNIYFPSGI